MGHSGGGARPIIPLLKRLGFLSSDGTPTSRYDRFRNAHTQAAAMAEAMREGYKEIFDRNEYAGDLSKEKLHSLITEITGLERDSRVVQSTVSTFIALKEFADFEERQEVVEEEVERPRPVVVNGIPEHRAHQDSDTVGVNLSYTINLNLPETSDPDVFNAIFKALRENLLKN